MADKTSFTKDEWTLLLESPMIAGMAITAAEPSGLWGLLKESFAGGTALAQAATGSGTNALVKSVVTDFSSGEGRSAARDGLKTKFANSKPAEMKGKCIDELRHVSALLAAKAPGDAAEFKNWLRQISQSTAEAASEGGGPVQCWSQGERRREGDPRRDIDRVGRLSVIPTGHKALRPNKNPAICGGGQVGRSEPFGSP
jgi:hypothetical protein